MGYPIRAFALLTATVFCLSSAAYGQQIRRISGIDNQTGDIKDSNLSAISADGKCILYQSTSNTNSCYSNGFGNTVYMFQQDTNSVSVVGLKEGLLHGNSTDGAAISDDCSVVSFVLSETSGAPPQPSQVYWRTLPHSLAKGSSITVGADSLLLQTPYCDTLTAGETREFIVQNAGEIELSSLPDTIKLEIHVRDLTGNSSIPIEGETCINDTSQDTQSCSITEQQLTEGDIIVKTSSLVTVSVDFTIELKGEVPEGYASTLNGQKTTGSTSTRGGIDINGDGRYIVFETSGDNLSENDSNGHVDVYLHDTITKETLLFSRAENGLSGNGDSRFPRISSDGSTIVFHSLANDLESTFSSTAQHVYRMSRTQSGTSILDTNNLNEISNSNSSGGADISSSGQFVAFGSSAENLVVPQGSDSALIDNDATSDIFINDHDAATTEQVSLDDSDGVTGTGNDISPSISGDGRYVAFVSQDALVTADTNGVNDIYIRDTLTNSTLLASVAHDGALANGSSADPRISLDGQQLVFDSEATNLTEDDNNNVRDVFLTDLNFLLEEGVDPDDSNTVTPVSDISSGSSSGSVSPLWSFLMLALFVRSKPIRISDERCTVSTTWSNGITS